ncbi:Kelch domain-containing protein 3 [Linum perenne]
MRWERLQRHHHNAAGAGLDGLDGPGKRWGHTCNSVRGGRFLYIFGGYGRDNCHTNQVHVFDTVTHTWSQPPLKGTPPIPRDSHSCTTVGEHLYVFGGTDGVKPLRDLHILNTSTHTWISPTMRGDGPEAREGHSAAVVGKRIYIFGGCGQSSDTNNEVYYNDLYILNTETFVWKCATTSGSPPSPRDSHTCSSWRNNIIVIGGEDDHDYYLSDVHILNAETLVWKELSTMGQKLPPRAGHSTVSFGKNLFVFGGFADSQNLYNDLYMLDIESGMWTKVMAIGDGPCARFSAACDSLDPLKGGVLVFIGGCDKHLEALDDMYYLHTGLTSIQDNWRAENLSWRKQLKLKCQEQSFNSDNSNRVDPTASFHGSMPTYGRHGPETVHFNVLQVHQGKKTFQATVAETFPYGYTIETIIDGKPLRGLLFSNRPSSPPVVYNGDRKKRLSDEIGGVVSNGDYTSRAKASRTSSKDEIDRPQVVGSHENESVMQDLKAEGSVAANVKSIVSSDASQLQESGANLEAAATLNLNDDMKVDGPNSAIDIPKEISTPTALSLNQGVNLIAMIFST